MSGTPGEGPPIRRFTQKIPELASFAVGRVIPAEVKFWNFEVYFYMRRAITRASRCSATTLALLCSVRARPLSMLAVNQERLQRALDSVSIGEPPRIELTLGEATMPSNGLAVLDSSFNPPTRAHLHMLDAATKTFGMGRSLLLLAKQNADKPVVGASLVQRLEMMEAIAATAEPPGSMLCGVTAHPLFVDKATALQQLFGDREGGVRIVVLVGFDTWVRIVDPKYYAPGGLDAALRDIFRAVEVLVASRDPASVSNLEPLRTEEQEALVLSLSDQVTGGRLHFLRNDPLVADLSSSAVRKAVAAGDGSSARDAA